MSIAATYVSATSCTVAGDLSAEIVAGMRVKADCGADGTRKGTVSSATYASGTGLTTLVLTLDTGSLTSNLTGLLHGNDAPDSLANHNHTGTADGGALSGAPLAVPRLTGWREGVQALGTLTGNTTIDCSAGNVVTATIGAALTLSFSNVPASGIGYGIELWLTCGSTVYTVTFPTGTVWPAATSNAAPTLAASTVNIIALKTINGGTTWRGAAVTGYTS